MRLRGCLRFSGDRDLWTAGVQGLRERLNEALRRAGDEREMHIVPVGSYRVVDDGPALQSCGAISLARKDHAIRDLPYRHFADVADAKLPLACAKRIEREVPQPGGVGSRKQLKIAIEFALQAGVGWAHAKRRRQF